MIIPFQGRKGRAQFTVNAVPFYLNIEDCNVTFVTDEVEVTGFGDSSVLPVPFGPRISVGRCSGLDDFYGTLAGYVARDAALVPNGITGSGTDIMGLPAPAGLTQGGIITNVKLFLDKAIVPLYCGCTRVMVTKINYQTKVYDAWKFSVEVKCATGIIEHPIDLGYGF